MNFKCTTVRNNAKSHITLEGGCYFLAHRQRCQERLQKTLHVVALCTSRRMAKYDLPMWLQPSSLLLPLACITRGKPQNKTCSRGLCRHVGCHVPPSASSKLDEETVKREKESISSLLIPLQSPLSYCHAPLDKSSGVIRQRNCESRLILPDYYLGHQIPFTFLILSIFPTWSCKKRPISCAW